MPTDSKRFGRRSASRPVRGRFAASVLAPAGLGLAGLLLAAGQAGAADRQATFRNGTANWSNPDAWTPAGVPNNGALTYDATFNGLWRSVTVVDTLRLDRAITIERFTMTGGLFGVPNTGGPHALTLNGTFAWSGGTVGAANVVAAGGVDLRPAATCMLGSGTLDNRGVLTYAATFASTADGHLPLRLDGNGVVANRAGATFDIANDSGISVTSGTARIDNAGLFVKSGGTGRSEVRASFNDTGTLRVQSGTLQFLGGSTQHAHVAEASAGATLAFGGLTTFHPTSTLGGAGTLQVNGDQFDFAGKLLGGAGALELRGGQSRFKAGADVAALGVAPGAGGRALRLIGLGKASFDTGNPVLLADLASDNSFTPQSNQSIVLAGADELVTTRPATWTGGMIVGPYAAAANKFSVNAGLTISGAGMGIDHRVLENNSTITWAGGYIQVMRDAAIENRAGATFDVRTDTRIEWGPYQYNSRPVLNNAGLIVKSAGAGETLIDDVRLTNTGTVRVETGSLRLTHSGGSGGGFGWPDTGTNSGVYEVAGGAALVVTDHTMAASSVVRGAGTMGFQGNTNAVGGTYDVTGRTDANGGVDFRPGAKVTNVGRLLDVGFNGTVSFDTGGPITLNDVILNGRLGGSDPIVVTGTMTGAGTLTAASVVVPGDVSPGNSPGILRVQGRLGMTSSTDLMMELGGAVNTSQEVRFDVLSSTADLTLDGDLVLQLVNGYRPAAGDRLAIVSAAAGLAGAFDNVAPGGRLTTADGAGSFLVSYGPSSPFGTRDVVLSDYRAVPEPAAAGVLAVGGVLLLSRRRRR